MFAGSWAAGCVPLYVRMDNRKFNLLALFGAGLLIGAALAVILPEGIETLSKASDSRRLDLEAMNSTVGWSLVAGFSLMFLIDNLFSSSSHEEPHNDSGACLDEIPMAPRDARGSEYTLNDAESANGGRDWQPSRPRTRVFSLVLRALSPRYLPSTLIGILVHSCADGLALGAAVAAASSISTGEAADSTSLEIIVFLALLLHKAPAAFGLITTLKQQGHPTYKLSVWLTIFAASAPLAALATFSVVLLANHSKAPQANGSFVWTGVIMLFSAGTFLYVAIAHTLTEAVHHARLLRASGSKALGRLGVLDILVLLVGIVLPPLVSKDHD
ncbi:Zinc/iron permease [Coemansia spiralis]|nr:Zinc/iron permease [Coemansia spiralis]